MNLKPKHARPETQTSSFTSSPDSYPSVYQRDFKLYFLGNVSDKHEGRDRSRSFSALFLFEAGCQLSITHTVY